jgi:hypothetical protein
LVLQLTQHRSRHASQPTKSGFAGPSPTSTAILEGNRAALDQGGDAAASPAG